MRQHSDVFILAKAMFALYEAMPRTATFPELEMAFGEVREQLERILRREAHKGRPPPAVKESGDGAS